MLVISLGQIPLTVFSLRTPSVSGTLSCAQRRADNILLLHHPPAEPDRPRRRGDQGESEAARIEDWNNFEALVPRIYELGGKLPDNMSDFHNVSGCPPAKLPAKPRDVKAMLTVLVEAERGAVRQYTHVCNLTAGKDQRTYDPALSILNEEIEHESWFF